MRFTETRAAWALSLGLLAGQAHAETLSLAQAMQAVLRDNPELAVSQARQRQAETGLAQADGARLPRVNLSLTASRTNDALGAFGLKLGQERIATADFAPNALNSPDAINNLNTRVDVQAPLYTGGRLDAFREEARAQVRAAEAGAGATRQSLMLETLKAYEGVHLARAFGRVAEQSRAAATEFARIAEALQKQGMAVKSEVLSARVNLDDARLRVSESRRHEANALDQLKRLMGRPLGEALDVADSVELDMPAGGEDDLRALALQQHPGLRALQAQAEAGAAGIEAARAASRPQLSAMARHDWNDRGIGLEAASYTVAGVLSWSAFDGGVNKAAVDRAQAARLEQLARLREAQDGIAFQVTEAWRRAQEADERVTVREAAVKDAEEAQRLTQLRYRNGLTTQVDLFAMQAQLDKARADLAQARYDRTAARAEVHAAAGLLTPELFRAQPE